MAPKDENTQRLSRLKSIVARLPAKPGSYQFLDREGTIIYVGKAKNLRSRVASYFHREVDRYKTQVLVSKIADISYTVVRSEEDALLLENSLIKQYKPRYNVLLKDGKTYPSICITREDFPRIFKTRHIVRSRGEYFGPYSHVPTMYALLDIINKICRPRRCAMAMTASGVAEGKYKTCLEYHIKNCLAPCTGAQSQADYLDAIARARELLRGNTRALCLTLRQEMERAAADLRFEEAEEWKEKYLLAETYVARSEVVSHTITNIDVFSATDDASNDCVFINYLHVTEGAITQSFTFEYRRKIGESIDDLLLAAIVEIRRRYASTATEIVVGMPLDWRLPDGAHFFVPQRGDKRRLLELSELNCRQYAFDRLKQAEKLNPEQRSMRLMRELQQKLALEKLPRHIECFDNSNIAGADAVASCVVFKDMKPSKRDYRHFIIKTIGGVDDYASMQEVVERRYRRMVDEGSPLPDLIITDGGVGHVHAVEAVVGRLGLAIPVAGLAKDSRHHTNTLLFGDPTQTVALATTSDLFRALAHMQDEVHRFAITFHRDKRSKSALSSELDSIPGVGAKSREALLAAFHSVARLKKASIESIADVVGAKRGQTVFDFFHPQDGKRQDDDK